MGTPQRLETDVLCRDGLPCSSDEALDMGVDHVGMEEFDAQRSKHLYKLWNRMASGSYFPPPVKEVEIPKKDGKVRKLGIPTISNRVGQMVVKDYLEPRFEQISSPHSYGYRPNKNAHQALASVRENWWKTDWLGKLLW